MTLFIDDVLNFDRTHSQIYLNHLLDEIKRENNPQITSKIVPVINDMIATNNSIKDIQPRAYHCQDKKLKTQLTDQLCNEYIKFYNQSIDLIKMTIERAKVNRLSKMPFDENERINLFKKFIQTIKIAQSIYALLLKADHLENAGHSVAAEKTRALANKINTTLYEQKVLLTNNLKDCKDAFAVARPELEKHRDSNYIVANVILAIITAGVGFLLAALANKAITGNFLFFSKTDTASQADNLEQQIIDAAKLKAQGG